MDGLNRLGGLKVNICATSTKKSFFFRLENFELFLAKINNKGQKWIGILLGHLF